MRVADIGTGHHPHFGIGKTRVDTFVAQHALKIAGGLRQRAVRAACPRSARSRFALHSVTAC